MINQRWLFAAILLLVLAEVTWMVSQIDGMICSVKEMGSNCQDIIAKLRTDYSYVHCFWAIDPDAMRLKT